MSLFVAQASVEQIARILDDVMGAQDRALVDTRGAIRIYRFRSLPVYATACFRDIPGQEYRLVSVANGVTITATLPYCSDPASQALLADHKSRVRAELHAIAKVWDSKHADVIDLEVPLRRWAAANRQSPATD